MASTSEKQQPTIVKEVKEELSGNLKEPKTAEKGIIGEWCRASLIKEYGVIHLKNALNDEGQKQIWNMVKPRINDPGKKATGFHCFNICQKDHKNREPVKRIPGMDHYGKLLFTLAGDAIKKLSIDCSNEPSYQRLEDLANGTKPFRPGVIFGNYYRADAKLQNHVDSDEILFTMTLALGDDCEFHIGRPTNRSKRMSERSGKVEKIIMKSGDAVFFDGGSTPHEVVRIIGGTAPSWWDEMKVPNGSRLVIVFREQEESFLKRKIGIAKARKKKAQLDEVGSVK